MRRSVSVFAFALCLLIAEAAGALLIAETAGAQQTSIFQPGSQPTGETDGLVVAVQASRACRNCHGNYVEMEDYEPYDTWRGSLMGSAARDPIANAAIAIAEEDSEHAADFCLRCHTPTAWLAGRALLPEYDLANPIQPERLRPDALNLLSPDRDGIGCMVCHRQVAPPMPSMISNAQLVLADGDDGATRRGPYTYEPGFEPMHTTAQEPFTSSGALCGTCHDIHNPLLTGFRGTEATGRPFAIERTYSEWRNSAFGDENQTCQDCHMPEVVGFAAEDPPLIEPRPEMNRHDLAGGNVWVPLAIAEDVRALDPAAATMLEASSLRTEAMLESAATVEITASALAGDTATATVVVTNLSGHKLPTGYPEGRRMWLEVAVLDASGAVVAGSGRYDDATDELERDAQLRTYEVKLGVAGEPSFHFILNDTLLEDTRIPPRGFRAPVEADMAPFGRDYGDGAGGYRNFDEVSYSLGELCGEGTLTLRARLRFQATTREYIEFLRDEAPVSADPALAGRSWGQVAYDAWQTHGGDQPFDMEEVSVVLGASPGACPVPEMDAGMLADSGTPETDAGQLVDAGAGVDAGEEVGSGGCGCRVGGSNVDPRAMLTMLLLLLSVLAYRRR